MKLFLFFITALSANSTFAQSNPTHSANAVVSAFFQNLNPTAIATGALQKTSPSTTPSRELTPMLMFAKANWGVLSADTQSLVNPFFFRPTDGVTITLTGGKTITPFTLAQESTHLSTYFKFHYVTTGANAATFAFVQQLATEADKVWGQIITTMGYNAPPSDGSAGGDAKYDIYLLDIGSAGVYGYVSSDATTTSGIYPGGIQSYMVIDNDFVVSQFGYATPLTPAKVTLAHEFFHSIQYGYDSTEFRAFLESSATWMEDKVYPTIKDNLQYIGEVYVDSNGNGQYNSGESFTDRNNNGLRESGSQDYPELHLDSFGLSGNGLEQYGRFMWIRYLSDKHGDVLIKNILTAMGQTAGNNTYTAMDTSLQNIGSSLATAFHEFGIWNINTIQYQNGADYPIAWGDNLFQGGANISSNTSIALQPFSGKQKHLSTVYELIQNPVGRYTFTTVGTAKLSALTQTSAGGAYTINPIPLTAGQGVWSPPTALSKVTFVISNTSATDDTMTWQLTDGVTPPLPALSSSTTPIASNSSSGGCLSPTANHAYTLWPWLLLAPSLLFARRKHRSKTNVFTHEG